MRRGGKGYFDRLERRGEREWTRPAGEHQLRLTTCSGAPQADPGQHALPAPAQKKKTSASWAKDYHPVRKFKASLLGHIRVLIITEHPSTFCKRICSSASLLSKVEVVQFLCPRINYQQSVTDFCESSDGCCPLIKQLDVRKVVVRNLKSSGLPRELLGEAEWHPPSLKQVTLVLPDNGSMSRVEHDLPVHLQLGGLLPNCPDLKLKVLFLEDVPTPCDRKFSKGPPWFDRQKEFPLFVSQLVEILVPDTIHVRPLSIYGVDDLRFDHSFYWSDGEQEHYRAQARKHIEETYNKKPPPATGGSKSGLLFGSMEAYWDTDITGERTLRERELRESSLKGRREREAVKNSWLAKREGLKAKFTSGDWPKPPTDEELEEKHGRDRRRWPRDKHWRIEYAEVGDFDKDQYPTWFDLAERHALGFDKY